MARSGDDDDDFLRALAAAPERAPPEDERPERIGHFRIVERLGKGGMGVVYRAVDERLGRSVALKVLPRAFESDDERRRRFLREARAAAAVAHPNLITVYEIDQADGRIFIAMELVAGRSLRSRLDEGALPIAEAVRILREIARGLAKAHASGVVHRDLKPENVMLTVDGAVKLLDFGLAKRTADIANADTQTEDGRILGTPAYMSPEQAAGKPVDASSDIFSLGVMAYELVTGARPFVGANRMETLLAITRADPQPPSKLKRQLGDDVERLILRCLEKDPAKRFASADELGAALDAVRVTTRSMRPAALAFLAIALVLVGAGVASRAWMQRRTAHAAHPRHAVTMLDLPAPKTSSAEAAADYAIAMQALHDANFGVAGSRLMHASKLDGRFAAAYLQLASYGWIFDDQRRELAAASQSRALLSDRDRELLDMIQPVVLPEPPDIGEAARRAQRAAEHWPGDAQIAVYAGLLRGFAGDLDGARREFARALELDPSFAFALHEQAVLDCHVGDLDGCFAAADRCLALAPRASGCARRRAEVQVVRGQCEDVLRDAQRSVAAEPNGDAPYLWLADALAGRHAAPEALRDQIDAAAALTTEEAVRDSMRAQLYRRVDVYSGDFEAASRHQLEFERLIRRADPTVHNQYSILIYEESGERAKAVAIAEDRWKLEPRNTGALAELHLAGKISDADFRRARDASVQSMQRSAPPWRDNSWIDGYARTAATRADAEEALDVLARAHGRGVWGGVDGMGSRAEIEELLGRTYLLAGRFDGAIEHLRAATRSCPTLLTFLYSVRAHEQLGEALAATGDRAGACGEFRTVLSYWGNARPRSVTADKARAEMRRIGCPK